MNESVRRRRVALLRRIHAEAIAQNPVEIAYDRSYQEHDPATGGSRTVVQSVGPVTVRVYQDRYARETVSQPQGGTINQGNRWGMLAPHDADVRGDPEDGDQFVCPDGTFRIREVFTHRLGPGPENAWGRECDLMRVA